MNHFEKKVKKKYFFLNGTAIKNKTIELKIDFVKNIFSPSEDRFKIKTKNILFF